MNINVYRYDNQANYASFPRQCEPQKMKSPFEFSSPLGQPGMGSGSLIGGLVGSILGQILCPIPFLGAMVGGMIGSMMGALLESFSQMSQPCCHHNMGQQYGPMNQDMAGGYGFPMHYHHEYQGHFGPYCGVPKDFYNPPYKKAPPMFCQQEPTVAPGRFPEIGLLPWGNSQHQENTNQTTVRPQVAVALGGKNKQVQENVNGHNQGAQIAVNGAGVNEQVQTNVNGNNGGTQVAIVVGGKNKQVQENVNGQNQGAQIAVNGAGVNEQIQTNVNGDNAGPQTGQVAIGVNRQTQENIYGENRGPQVGRVVIGGNTQTQTNVTGDNAGTQTAGTLIGGNEQRQETATGENRGEQAAGTVFGSNTQVRTTETGQSSGNQTATTVVGDNTQATIAGGTVTTQQEARTVWGDNAQVVAGGEGSVVGQNAATRTGDNQQTVVVGGGSLVAQEAQTRHGNNEQAVVVGDTSIVRQEAQTVTGTNEQTVVGGSNVIVAQEAEGGPSVQTAVVESGSVTQVGGTEQNAATLSGPVVIDQQGPRFGEAQQDARGGDADDAIGQAAGQGFVSLFDNKTTANAELGAGNDRYTYEGNSEANHVRLDGGRQTGPDQDVVQIDTKGGDDTAVVNLSGDRDTYQIDMGRGNDRLVINEDGQRIRIVGENGQEVYRSQGWTEQDSSATVNGAENLTVYREDGSFARWNERDGLQEGRDPGQPGEMSPVAAARTLREYAGELDKAAGTGQVDGIIGRADLRAALENPETRPELRQAIEYTLGNEAMWRSIDASGGRGDRVDIEGLNRFIDGYETRPSYDANAPMSDTQATSVLNYHNVLLDTAANGGNTDGKFDLSDLRAITGDNNQSLPPELRAAAQHLLGDAGLRDRVDATSWETSNPFGEQAFSNADLAGFRG